MRDHFAEGHAAGSGLFRPSFFSFDMIDGRNEENLTVMFVAV
jgi:hypothetical protein